MPSWEAALGGPGGAGAPCKGLGSLKSPRRTWACCLPPAACVVVEDSRSGLAAAHAAGIGHIVALGPAAEQDAPERVTWEKGQEGQGFVMGGRAGGRTSTPRRLAGRDGPRRPPRATTMHPTRAGRNRLGACGGGGIAWWA